MAELINLTPTPPRKPKHNHRCAAVPRLVVGLLILAMLATSPVYASSKNTGEQAENNGQELATSRVDSLHEQLIRVMKQRSDTGAEQRYERLLGVVEEHFDVALIGRIALGRRHWANLSKEQRHEYVDHLRKLIAARYADRLGEFKGQEFRTGSSESTSSDRIAVKSELRTADSDTVSLHYRLFLRDDQWRIYDVVSKGVSDLSMMRSQFNEVFGESGFAALINTLDERISKYRGQSIHNNS